MDLNNAMAERLRGYLKEYLNIEKLGLHNEHYDIPFHFAYNHIDCNVIFRDMSITHEDFKVRVDINGNDYLLVHNNNFYDFHADDEEAMFKFIKNTHKLSVESEKRNIKIFNKGRTNEK